MGNHRPNVVPKKARVLLALCATLLALYCVVELAIGYTYLPGKRGGFLLSGLPTLLIAASLAALCVACAATIVDHYDRRPNEDTYKLVRRVCLKTALWSFISAPILEFLLFTFRTIGFRIPDFQGFASNYTLHSTSLRQHADYVTPLLDHGLPIALIGFFVCGIGWLITKHYKNKGKVAAAVCLGSGVSLLSLLFLASATHSFMLGEVSLGKRSYRTTVSASQEPAKFNAIILAHLTIGGTMLSAGLLSLVVGTVSKPKRKRVRRGK